jgi:hypothetical protein
MLITALMDTYMLEEDLTVFYVEAGSFPDGVGAAFHTLMKKLPYTEGRTLFGISWMDKSHKIIYKAAVREMYDGEAKKYGRKTFVIRRGIYCIETITDWQGKEARIGEAFSRLLEHPDLDKNGACVEWYTGDDVMCMVRLNNPV